MTDTVHGAAPAAARVSDAYRWTQLDVGVAAMVMIANYQYGWTFFVPDIQKKFGWDRASIQWAFTLFVLFETWLVPVEGWFVDKYGPRLVVLAGGVLCAIGWAINAEATTLNGYYLGMIIAGIGAGGVYGTCVGNALKWFPDKRGLAAGITAAGFGAGSALTVAPIQAMIKDSGFQTTFLYFGLGQGILIVLTRPFFGWISDMIGRENTMFIAFGIEGIGIWALYMLGHDPIWFVILSGLVFFAWGEIYSLFPSTCTDTFGAKFATTNAGLLYTAKGTASLLVPVANYIQQSSGSWDHLFLAAAAAKILASLLAILVLKPWRRSVVAKAVA